MMECREVISCLDKQRIIDKVSFTTEKGDIVGIIGPNGSGKTTLLRSILGHIEVESGDILVEGKSIKNYSLKKRAKTIGWVSSELNCLFNYTVLDIIKMGRFPYHESLFDSFTIDHELIDSVLELTKLGPLKHKIFNHLSSGEKQRVQLAKALVQAPSILLLDEPISHLDMKHQDNFINILKKKNKESQMTIIMVSHHIEAILKLCSNVLFLKEGKITKEGKTKEILTTENIKVLFDL